MPPDQTCGKSSSLAVAFDLIGTLKLKGLSADFFQIGQALFQVALGFVQEPLRFTKSLEVRFHWAGSHGADSDLFRPGIPT
ncbi:hypothetical protein [Bradyrhizobium sp. 144]|uniref:hypothetical protein n=1 Tax=Bradyrhizobium sp. 144 TaxID=2782620 RepID=UPI001FF8645C|nr:hypothetical protein [Bradyrhizobium sp. 144]MCK1698295.1 hypothetical protein [Bradyrhizobium sp. 144]